MSRNEWFLAVFAIISGSALGTFASLIAPVLPLYLTIPLFGTAAAVAAFGVLSLRHSRSLQVQLAAQRKALDEISRAAAGGSERKEAQKQALDIILQHTRASAARLWLVMHDPPRLGLEAQRGLFADPFQEETLHRNVSGSIGEFDETPAVRAVKSGEFVHVDNPNELGELASLGFVEWVALPLRAHDRVVGVLEVGARGRGELDAESIRWLGWAGQTLAGALANAEELEQARVRAAEAERLWEASLEVAGAHDYASLLRTVVEHSRQLIGAESSALCIWDEPNHRWAVQGVSGAADAFEVTMQRFERPNGDGYDCPVLRFKYRRAHLDVPLIHNGRVVGCLCVANREPRAFTELDRARLGGIAEHAARAVDHALQLEHAGSRAAATERERLAREMHDTLAQLLGFVNVKTGAVRVLLAQGQLEQADQQLDQIQALSQELYADTRELILGLRTQTTTQQGLVAALTAYAEWFQQLSGISTTVEGAALADTAIPPTTELQVIRVVQEALSNVRKHANARHARVSLTRDAEDAVIEISDDGRGFDPQHVTRGLYPQFGLNSMRERVESVGGAFALRSSPGQGTTVVLRVPLAYRAAAHAKAESRS